MDKINVAVIGCGYVAEGHLKAWRRLPYANVAVVCDLNTELLKKTAEVWKIPSQSNSVNEVLERGDINVVDICTPPQVHAKIACAAMEAGINVLIEKPMTMSVEDAQNIVDCQKKQKVTAAVLHNWLFDKPVLVAKSLVASGQLGEVFNVEIEALSTKMDSMAANEHHWCHNFPGGRFSENIAHPIYLARHFLGGELEILGVAVSKIGDYAWMKSDELCAYFRVENKFGRAYASFNSPRDAIYINLYGRQGLVKLDIINSTLNLYPPRETARVSKAFDSIKQASQLFGWTMRNAFSVATRRWSSGHDTYIRLFAEGLLDNSGPPVDVAEGLAVVKTVDQVCEKIDQIEKQR